MTYTYVPPTDLDSAARAVIRHLKRALLVPGRQPQPADRDDLAQDLALHAHVIAGRHDPARGSTGTFYDRALRNKVRSIRAKALCQKRDRRREQSLNGGDPAVHVLDTADHLDLAIDVRDALAPLTPVDREIAWLLARSRGSTTPAWPSGTRTSTRAAGRRWAPGPCGGRRARRPPRSWATSAWTRPGRHRRTRSRSTPPA